MTPTKPLIPKIEQRAEQVYQFMKGNGYVTKGELCALFGWDYPKQDRQIRDVISVCSHKYPILSTSDSSKGFKVAEKGDMDEIDHSIAELVSRIDELRKRVKPLIDLKQRNTAPYTLFS